ALRPVTSAFDRGNAMSWLHRISLSQKFVVLGVLALVMMALPTTLYLLRTADEVRTAERRVEGATTAIALQKVIQMAQNHRDVTVGALGTAGSLSALWQDDNEALSSLRPAARAALLESIAAFESQRAQVRTSEAFAAGWNEGLEQWKALDKSLESGELKSAERSTDLHGKWIDAMLLLSEALIEDFGLTRAPERDSN